MIYSDTFYEHVQHVKTVLQRLSDAGITMNLKKSKFAENKVNFLGFIVGDGKVFPDSSKVEAINDFPRPENKKKIRSFLGLLLFYRRFVPNLAQTVAILNELLRKNKPDKIAWSREFNGSFESARKAVCNNVLLYIPKKGYKFVVQTDASQE